MGTPKSWTKIYAGLAASGLDLNAQLAGTVWLDRYLPTVGAHRGRMLDLGCGLGADMLRCARLGYEPFGLDLETQALEYLTSTYGFPTRRHDLNELLPFTDVSFRLVISRFALHYLHPAAARTLFKEVWRVLEEDGFFLFVVNSETHRRFGLQYDYTDAAEVEPNYWHLPHDRARTFLFYTADIARSLLGNGWIEHHLADEYFIHWDKIEKWVMIGCMQKVVSTEAQRVGRI